MKKPKLTFKKLEKHLKAMGDVGFPKDGNLYLVPPDFIKPPLISWKDLGK